MAEPASSLLGFFLSAAQTLGKVTDWLLTRRQSGREQVAAYFERVADCLQEVAERIEAGEAPHDTCSRLAVYADELEGILKDREYLRAARDASIEETRSRLEADLNTAQNVWAPGPATIPTRMPPTPNPNKAAAARLAMLGRGGERTSLGPGRHPAEATVQRAQQEVAARAADRTPGSTQPVWDAAGQFRALAHSLRAR
jgi:hypothetical protein